MQITGLSVQKNNPKRVNLSVDGKFISGMSLQLAVENKLKTGLILEEKVFLNLLNKIVFEDLLTSSLNFLSFRPHSEKEIRFHLKQRINKQETKSKTVKRLITQKDKIIDDVCNRLKEINQINDNDFIKWWIEQRQMYIKKGIRAIKQELLQKGISLKVIDEYLENHKNELKNDLGMAITLVQKRQNRYIGLDKKKQKEKIYSFLLQRGFSYDTIEEVIDRVL